MLNGEGGTLKQYIYIYIYMYCLLCNITMALHNEVEQVQTTM